jgi:hypothetical protein
LIPETLILLQLLSPQRSPLSGEYAVVLVVAKEGCIEGESGGEQGWLGADDSEVRRCMAVRNDVL